MVDGAVADRIGVALDFDEVAARVLLEIGNHLIDPMRDFRRQLCRAELEVAFILVDDDFVDKAARGGVDSFDPGVRRIRLVGCGGRGVLRRDGGGLGISRP